jgi:hypothetical protein
LHWREDLTQSVHVRAIVAGLTPLGAEIKQRYSSELLQGRAIRWDGRVAESASAARQDGSSLLDWLEQSLREVESYLKQIIALIVSANPPGARDDIERLGAVIRVLKAIAVTKPKPASKAVMADKDLF